MVLACLLGYVGILLDSPILIIGAMVVGPEFGPIAALCVAIVQRRSDWSKRSLLAAGGRLPARSSLVGALLTLADRRRGRSIPDGFSADDHPFTQFISNPDAFVPRRRSSRAPPGSSP